MIYTDLSFDVCGERGIRTPGTVARTPHFECGPIDHSGISPKKNMSLKLSFRECKYRHNFYFCVSSDRKKNAKTRKIPCGIRRIAQLFVSLTSLKILLLGKAQINLALPSLIRIFGFAEDTPASTKSKRVWFCFRLIRIFDQRTGQCRFRAGLHYFCRERTDRPNSAERSSGLPPGETDTKTEPAYVRRINR